MKYQSNGNQAMLAAMRKPFINTELFQTYLHRAKPYIEQRVEQHGTPVFKRAKIYRQILNKYVLSR